MKTTEEKKLHFADSCDYSAIVNNWGCGFKNLVLSEYPLTRTLKTDVGFAGIRCLSAEKERSLPHSALFWTGNHKSLTDFRECTSNSQCATGYVAVF